MDAPPSVAPEKTGRSFSRNFLLILLLAVLAGVGLVFGVSRLGELRESPSADQPLSLPPPPEISPDLISDLLPRDSIQSIDKPLFESASKAGESLEEAERVIGLVINGDARAYPISILSSHEIVNDIVGGEPVAVTWCPLCYSALVFSRRLEGQAAPLTFGVSGKLLQNTLVMYDRETESLWSQLYGAALDGEQAGLTLGVYPSVLTEWSVWLAQHPDTLVLSKRLTCEQFGCGSYSDNPRGSYDVDPYESYYATPLEGVVDYQIPRDASSLDRKKRVLGLRANGVIRAYPYDVLRQEQVINDVLGELPVLVWFDGATETGSAYNRRVNGQTLSFIADPESGSILLDRETGTRWQATSGEGISGPLAGTRLEGIVSTPAFEFGWYGYFPESDTYGGEFVN